VDAEDQTPFHIDAPQLFLDPGSMAFSIITTGEHPSRFSEALLFNDIIPAGKNLVNEKMRIICQEIIAMANESCRRAANKCLTTR
jgi:hypothetical protein